MRPKTNINAQKTSAYIFNHIIFPLAILFVLEFCELSKFDKIFSPRNDRYFPKVSVAIKLEMYRI